jgi:hypothetical protein
VYEPKAEALLAAGERDAQRIETSPAAQRGHPSDDAQRDVHRVVPRERWTAQVRDACPAAVRRTAGSRALATPSAKLERLLASASHPT